MRKSFLSLVGGAVLGLLLVVYSCGNVENPLEKIVNAPYYAPLTDALKNNAKVVVEYTLFGDLQAKQLEFTFDGGLEQFSEIATPVAPADQNYTLKPVLDYDQNKGEIIFTLTASQKDVVANLRGGAKKVLVVVFDVKAQTYKVAGLPGFTFKVLKIEGYEADVKNAWPEKAEVALKKVVYEGDHPTIDDLRFVYMEGMEKYPFVINYEKGKTWGDIMEYYPTLLDDEKIIDYDVSDGSATHGSLYLNFEDYSFIYYSFGDYYVFEILASEIMSEENVIKPEYEIVLPTYPSWCYGSFN